MESMTTAAERLLTPGPEEQQLGERAGTWNVVATMWPAPDAKPIVTNGLIAERTMIGSYLQEIMRPALVAGRTSGASTTSAMTGWRAGGNTCPWTPGCRYQSCPPAASGARRTARCAWCSSHWVS